MRPPDRRSIIGAAHSLIWSHSQLINARVSCRQVSIQNTLLDQNNLKATVVVLFFFLADILFETAAAARCGGDTDRHASLSVAFATRR